MIDDGWWLLSLPSWLGGTIPHGRDCLDPTVKYDTHVKAGRTRQSCPHTFIVVCLDRYLFGRTTSLGHTFLHVSDGPCTLLRAKFSHTQPIEECPICAESLDDNPWSMATLPCCKQSVCWVCLCRHSESVIDDARPDMNCPLSCDSHLLSLVLEVAWIFCNMILLVDLWWKIVRT